MLLLYIILCTLTSTIAKKGMLLNVPYKIYENQETVLKNWNQMENNFHHVINNLVDSLWSFVNDSISSNNTTVSDVCKVGIRKVFTDAKELKIWALELLDANPFHRGGELFDNHLSLGNYEECVNINSKPWNGYPSIRGDFCILNLQPHLPTRKDVLYYNDVLDELKTYVPKSELLSSMKHAGWEYMSMDKLLGICFPSTCTQMDVMVITNNIAEKLNFLVGKAVCDSISKPVLEKYHIVIIVVLFSIIMASVISAVLQEKFHINKNAFIRIFSLTENIRAFGISKIPRATSHLNGLKFIAMIWNILGHTAGMRWNSFQMNNQIHAMEGSRSFWQQPMYNSIVCEDLFFIVSGFLVGYLTLTKDQRKNGFFFEVMFPIFMRILRIVPIVLLVIAITLLMPLTGSGAFWNYNNYEITNRCLERWWSILFIGTNFERTSESCIAQAWYICVDIQLSVVVLILVFVQKRHKKIGNAIFFALLIISLVSVPISAYFSMKQPALIFHHVDLNALDDYLLATHEPQHHLLPSLLGYGLAKLIISRKPKQIPLVYKTLGWTISISLSAYVLFYPWVWNNGGYLSMVDKVVFSALSLPIWCLSICWLIYICSTKNGGFLNRFLSLSFLNYLNKLLLLVYLINAPLSGFFDWRHDYPIQSDDMSLFGDSLKIWMISYLFAFVLYIFFETPLSNIIKMIVSKIILKEKLVYIANDREMEEKEDAV